jgi:hypothetical protein
MRKILLVFDGTAFSEGAFDFVKELNKRAPVLATGVFLPQVQLANLWSYAEGASGTSFIPLLESRDAEKVQKNIKRFENLCKQNNIAHRVHKDAMNFALPELKKESRFADLVIIGSEYFYTHLGASGANEYLQDALHESECPVLLVPEAFVFPANTILAYDGSKASVYAIKQFAYLFPEMTKNETLLVYAKKDNNTAIPEEPYIEELAARHFPDLTILKLDINPEKDFTKWTRDKENAILVSGSFGRSYISRAFKKSFITHAISDHLLPVFIAHR